MTEELTSNEPCKRCLKQIDTLVVKEIVHMKMVNPNAKRARDRKRVVTEAFNFCSERCGDEYQWSCEG